MYIFSVVASHIDGNADRQGRRTSRLSSGEWHDLEITQTESGGTVIYFNALNVELFPNFSVHF